MGIEIKMIDTDADVLYSPDRKKSNTAPEEGELSIYVASTVEPLAGDLDEFQERVAAAAKVPPSALMRPLVVEPVNEGDADPIVIFVSKS